MQRRAVMRLLSTATAGAVAGLAGCSSSGNGEDKPVQCNTPAGDLEVALPRGGKFSQPTVDTNNSASEIGGAERHVLGSYRTDDETYLFFIAEYVSGEAARDAATDEEIWASFDDHVTGYVVIEEYAYVVMGPTESDVRELMTQAGPLGDNCVGERITFL